MRDGGKPRDAVCSLFCITLMLRHQGRGFFFPADDKGLSGLNQRPDLVQQCDLYYITSLFATPTQCIQIQFKWTKINLSLLNIAAFFMQFQRLFTCLFCYSLH